MTFLNGHVKPDLTIPVLAARVLRNCSGELELEYRHVR
jgi:hypothetical protein